MILRTASVAICLFAFICRAETVVATKSGTINPDEIGGQSPVAGKLQFSRAPMRRPVTSFARLPESQSETPPAAALPPAPYALSGFAAVLDNLNSVPPDTMGAVGPQHVVTMLNDDLLIQRRNGVVLSHISPMKFWEPLAPFHTLTDPRILYDAAAGRWVATMTADPDKETTSLFVAASKTGDPTGSWFLQRFDVGPVSWGDFPSLGLNKNWVVVTLNMFQRAPSPLPEDFVESHIYVFNKAKLYAGAVAPHTLFRNSAFGFSPAVDYDNASDTFYLVQVDSETLNAQSLRVSLIQGAVGSETFTPKPGIHTAVAWAQDAGPGGSLPQLGSTVPIDAGDDRIQNCVLRKSSLWCTHTAFSTSTRRSMVQWWQIDTAALQIQQNGRIDDPMGVNFYAYPSIAVNKNGDMLLGYSRFSAGQYASADYSLRLAGDPPNTLRSDTVFKQGEAPYNRTMGDAFSNRWGDFSATVVDPLDDTGFWTIQEYAASPSVFAFGAIDRWGTWWAQIVPLASGAAPCVFSLAQASQSIVSTGGPGSIGVSAAAACPWMAASNVPWIVIQDGTPGTGSGQVHFNVAINDRTTTSRSGTISVAGQSFTVTQAGASALPDLTVTGLTASTLGYIGGQIQVSATVRNIGIRSAQSFRVAFYLSTSTTASPVSPPAAFCAFDRGLEAAAVDICSAVITLPLTLAPGLTYLSAVADDQNLVGEIDKSNNFRLADSGAITLKFDPARPALTSAGIVNAASLLPGPVSPGLMVIVSGSNIGPATLTKGAPDASGKLDTMVSDAQLLFDGVASPLISVSREQTKAIVPYAVAGKKTTQVQVQYAGILSNVVTVPVADAAPGIFTVPGGNGQALMMNEDGSANSIDNPAAPGSTVVLYGSGEGQTDPPGVDGQFATDVLPTPLLPVGMRIGGEDAIVISAAAALGQAAGLLQLTVRVPDGLSAGDAVPAVLTVGSASSQPGVTIAVK